MTILSIVVHACSNPTMHPKFSRRGAAPEDKQPAGVELLPKTSSQKAWSCSRRQAARKRGAAPATKQPSHAQRVHGIAAHNC
eukprot:365419-Chlamydomonas_euryale.AAC.6